MWLVDILDRAVLKSAGEEKSLILSGNEGEDGHVRKDQGTETPRSFLESCNSISYSVNTRKLLL